ncbi:MAG: Heavy-metal resistance [Rhodospirillales bacterium]|nr:Heavy-metal resistance [Rhodospirillales bacterium]
MNRSRVIIVLAVLLVISVGLNLFFAGMAGGRLFRPGPGPAPGTPPSPGQVSEMLPKDDRPAFRSMLHARGPALRASGLAQREAGLGVVAAARAEPFDAETLRRRLGALRDAQRSARELRDEAFVDLMQHLSPQGRQELVNALPSLKEQPPSN